VSGIKYYFEIEFEGEIYNVSVWEQPWKNFIQIVDIELRN